MTDQVHYNGKIYILKNEMFLQTLRVLKLEDKRA